MSTQKSMDEAGEMTQSFRTLDALPEGLGTILEL